MKTFLTLMLGATILMGAQSARANIVDTTNKALKYLDEVSVPLTSDERDCPSERLIGDLNSSYVCCPEGTVAASYTADSDKFCCDANKVEGGLCKCPSGQEPVPSYANKMECCNEGDIRTLIDGRKICACPDNRLIGDLNSSYVCCGKEEIALFTGNLSLGLRGKVCCEKGKEEECICDAKDRSFFEGSSWQFLEGKCCRSSEWVWRDGRRVCCEEGEKATAGHCCLKGYHWIPWFGD